MSDRGIKVDVRARLRSGTIQELHEQRREAWRDARVAEMNEPTSPTDWQRWDGETLLQGLEFARVMQIGAGAMVDMVAEALARAELRGERRVRLDIEMERSNVRSEKP